MSPAIIHSSSQRRGIPPGVWGLLLLVPSIALLVNGVLAWQAASAYKAPTVVSYFQFTKLMP